MVILATLPTLDASGVAVRQISGRAPTAGSGSPMHRLEVPSLPVWLLALPLWPPATWTRVKGLQAAPPLQVAPGGRRRRGDAGCIALMGRSFRSPQKRQRTTGGAEEASSQAHGAQRRVSPPVPPPPPPSVPTPPPPSVPLPPPPSGGDLP
jgi:hypothetical protein